MTRWIADRAALYLVFGVVAGIAVTWFAGRTPIEGAMVDRTEGLIMATGPIDNDIECLALLDTLSGDLIVTVVNPQNGQFMAKFEAKPVNDLQIDASKNPKFSLALGAAQLRTSGQQQYGQCVIYVAEASSGKLGAYAIPFNRSALNARTPLAGQLQFLSAVPFRQAIVR